MLESYFQEIKQKRRRKLFFWFLVFFFAILLYFFFKGKYVSININWNNLLSQSGAIIAENNSWSTATGSKSADIFAFNSFGIVNVKVFPKDASIWLNDKTYINDSKPWLDYDHYKLSIWKEGYIDATIEFDITEEKNFYIDDITLLKKPEYKRSETLYDGRIINIGDNSWITYTSSGMMLYQKDFSTWSLISTATFDHLGEGNFFNGKTVMNYSLLEGKWIPNTTLPVQNFLKKCPNTRIQKGLFYCGDNSEVMTSAGKIFTGVTLSGNNFLKTEKQIILGDFESGNVQAFALTGASVEGTTFIEINSEWRTNSGGTLVSAINTENKNLEIILDLDEIIFTKNIWKNVFVIGKKDNEKTLVIFDSQDPKKNRYISIPSDVELSDIRIYEKNRNFFLKTTNSLLFIYRESSVLEWIIHGKILAIGENFAIYETNSEIWIADWSVRNSLE